LENTVSVGTLGELAVRKELHRQGYAVYIPQCDNAQVDMVVEFKKGGFSRVQVKTVTKLKTSTSIQVNLQKYKYSGRVDCVAVYYPPEDIIAFVPYTNQDSVHLALKNAKNNQRLGRHWFYAYSDFPESE
jgi:hypothetical protein